jgi:hypothetical protein
VARDALGRDGVSGQTALDVTKQADIHAATVLNPNDTRRK